MKSRVKQMTEGKPFGLIVAFAIPLMFGNMFQQLYSVVDSMVVGRTLGVEALAALGVCSSPGFVMIGMLMGLSQGVSIKLARAFGKKDYKELKDTFANAILIAIIFTIVLSIVSQLLALPFLRVMGTASEIEGLALSYLRVTYIGIPVLMVYNLLAASLRALGNSKTPLTSMMVASVVNVALDILFVVGFGLGIAGAAWATVLAQVLSALICLREIVVHTKELHLAKGNFKVRWNYIKEMLIVSAPMLLQSVLISLGGMVVLSQANQFRVVFVAGFTAGKKMHMVLEIATSSLGFAMTTYVAQNLGAGHFDRIHAGVRAGMKIAIGTSIVIALVMLLAGKLILSGFVSGSPQDVADTINIGYQYLMIMCFCLPVLYLLYVFRSSTQGLGNTFLPMCSAMSELVMRIASAVILAKYIGETGIFIAEVAAWFGADVVLILSYIYVVRKEERQFNEERAALEADQE